MKKNYIRKVETVHAKQMLRGEYNILRGWTIPEDENPKDEGFIVLSAEGAEAEHVTWVPQHVFESNFAEIHTDTDDAMEKEIVDKGLTYPRIPKAYIDFLSEQMQFDCHLVPDSTTTVVTAYIPVGPIKFTLASEIMACIDPRNFDKALGEKYGIEKTKAVAVNKLWELEGYALAKKMYCPAFTASKAA